MSCLDMKANLLDESRNCTPEHHWAPFDLDLKKNLNREEYEI